MCISVQLCRHIYLGKGDQTICFHCGGGLKDWEESDEPWVEHARWFSRCNFVLMIKGKEFVDEVCGRKTAEVRHYTILNKILVETD